MRRTLRLHIAATLLFLSALAPALPARAEGYHVLTTFAVAGEGGWDYLVVDAAARRLYVTRGTRVMVLDADSGKSVGEIPGNGLHGVALAPEFGKGFSSNGRGGTVTMFETASLKILSEIKATGENPDAILYDPFSKRIFAFNGRSGNVTAIEAASGTVAGTVTVGGKPEFAASDEKGRIFVNIEDKNEVVVFDSKTLAAGAHWPLAPCESPTGMAIDSAHGRLFAGCGNKMMAVLDISTGRVITTVPTGSGTDANAWDSELGLAFSSNGEGTLTVIQQESKDAYKVVENVPTQLGARTMALDPKTHRIFLAAAKYGPAPPEATADNPRRRPPMVPGSFVILVVGR